MTNLVAVLENRARAGGWADAVGYLEGGARRTYAEVYGGAALTGGVLAERGVGRGDPVLVALPDGVELIRVFFGVLRLGAVAVLVDPSQPPAALREAVVQARPVLAVCPESLAPELQLPALHPAALTDVPSRVTRSCGRRTGGRRP